MDFKHLKLINEGFIDLDPDFEIMYQNHFPDSLTVKDVYGQIFCIPISSILYFYNNDDKFRTVGQLLKHRSVIE